MPQTDRASGLVAPLGVKSPCRVATTANTTLYGLQTIDGVVLVAGDRVLVRSQTSGVENGIYVASASNWERAADFDGDYDVRGGTLIRVISGALNARTTWECTSDGDLRVGVDSLTFAVTLNSNLDALTLGKTVIGYFPAASMKPSTTNGCAPLAWIESTTNKVLTGVLGFDWATVEYAQFSFHPHRGLDEAAGLVAMFEWSEGLSGGTSHGVVWQIEAQAQGDADALDGAWGSAVSVTDAGTGGTRRLSPQTPTITPGGSWSEGDSLLFRVSRMATDVSDTLNVDANLIGVTLYGTYNTHVEP